MLRCKKGHEVRVYVSGSGQYYIGTIDKTEEGWDPNCRLSIYYATQKEAEEALKSGSFAHRHCVENDYCSGETGCHFKEVK